MKAKKLFLVLLILLTALCAVSAKSVTEWWSGYTTVDDFNFGKVNVFYRAWNYSDGSQTIVCVYLDPSDTRVQYETADFADASKLPFAQITDIPYKGTINVYNLATNANKFSNFQFTLYSANKTTATMSFKGSVVAFGSKYSLYTDKATANFSASDASVIPDIELTTTELHRSGTNTSGSSSTSISKEEAAQAIKDGVELTKWIVNEVTVDHPAGTIVCDQCNGTGVCSWCKGTGKSTSGFMCSHCNFLGDGKCSRCKGQGWY